MSSRSIRGHSFGMSYRSRKDITDGNNLFSMDSNRALHLESPDMNNSKLDFLDKQTYGKEQSYKFWLGICNIANIFMALSTMLIVVVWFYWLENLNSDDMRCVELKTSIMWVVVVYIIGIFSQILGFIAGYTQSSIGYLLYEMILLMLFTLRLILDIPTTNLALQFLEGCTRTRASVDLAYYIFGTIFYCIMTMILFTCNLNMLISIRKVRKAQRVQHEYLLKSEKYGSSQA